MSDLADKISVTIKEARAMTGLSAETLYRYHYAGKITMKKAGRRTIIMAAELRALVADLPEIPRNAA